MTPEKLNDLRRKVLNKEPVNDEEYAQAVRLMVADRIAKIESPEPKAKRTTKASSISLDDLVTGS